MDRLDATPFNAMPDIDETALRQRFDVAESPFAHGPVEWRLLHPRCAHALIDEQAFEHDERLPYWADLWPASRALTRRLLDQPVRASRAIELGCGLALPSLALQHRNIDVLATDYEEDGLAFAQINAARNGLGQLKTMRLDWRSPDPALGRFDLIVAADVLYEQRNAEALAKLLPLIIAPGGTVMIADPQRRYAADLIRRIKPLAAITQHRLDETRTGGVERAASIDLIHLRFSDSSSR